MNDRLECYEKYERSLKSAGTEQEVLSVLIEAISDKEMNRIGGPLYSGYGEELGETATRRLLEIRKPERDFEETCRSLHFYAEHGYMPQEEQSTNELQHTEEQCRNKRYPDAAF